MKKFLSILLVLTMLLTLLPMEAIASSYNDTTNHWAKDEITKWSDLGIIQGSDGLFRPSDQITRGEMAVILDRLMNYQVKASNGFVDLDTSWYTDAILRANKAGIILGNNGKVHPNSYITREEAIVMLGRALLISESAKNANFSDMKMVSDWAKGYVNALSSERIISGVGNNSFAPKANVTRSEVVKILDNAIKGLYNKAGEYSSDSDGDVIINTSSVTLKDMEISGNLIIAEGVGEGEVTLDNVNIKGNTIVKGGGKNSVYFNNVTVEGSLIVNKVGGDLRIVVTGTSSVSVAVLDSGAILVTKDLIGGGIEKVVIPANIADGQNVVLQGNFNTVENNAAGITLKATGKIDNLILNEKTTVIGDATVNKVTTAPSAESVINGKVVSGGQNGSPINSNTVSQTTNGGNSTVYVTGVSLNKSAVTLEVGDAEILTATVTPTNASNKNVIWTSSNPSVAAVTTNGAILAVTTGTSIITVTTDDGGKTASCDVLVKNPQTLLEAKTTAENKIASMNVSNKTTAEDIMSIATGTITNKSIKANWSVPFAKAISDFDNDGSISGTIILTLEGETTSTADIIVSKIIPKLVKSPEKAITAFEFSELTPAVNGVINETSHTIELTVLKGTDVTSLIPTITVSEYASVNPVSGKAQDFSSPVTYTVTAQNGTTQNYIVTVTSAETIKVPAVSNLSVKISETTGDLELSYISPVDVKDIDCYYYKTSKDGVNWFGLNTMGTNVTNMSLTTLLSNSDNCSDGNYQIKVVSVPKNTSGKSENESAYNKQITISESTPAIVPVTASCAGFKYTFTGLENNTFYVVILSTKTSKRYFADTYKTNSSGELVFNGPNQVNEEITGVKLRKVIVTGDATNGFTLTYTATPSEATVITPSVLTYTVTFNSNGGSDVAPITGILNGNKITLPSVPTKSDVEFIGWFTDINLQNKFDVNTPITSNITLYAKWSGWQKPIEIDHRFATGYPKSSVNNGVIEIKIKLTGPAEVFMVVNQINSKDDVTDTTAVIHGHSGTEDNVICVDEAPYINITDTEEHIVTTNVSITGGNEVKIYFVVKDNNETSATPTLLEYSAEAVAELDNLEPYFECAYINSKKDKITLYFDESLDTSSIPDVSDFRLSNGKINSIAVNNYGYRQEGRVELSVSEITDINNLTISYTGNKLRDIATTPNEVIELNNESVSEATVSIPKDNVFVSHNGQYINILVNKSLDFDVSTERFDLDLKYGEQIENAKILEKDKDYSFTYSYRNDGSSMDIYVKLNSVPQLIAGGKYFITFITNGSKDFAGDTVDNIEVQGIPSATAESSVIPTANYDTNGKKLVLSFPDDCGLEGDVYACFFKINNADKEYILRGQCWYREEDDSLTLTSENFPFDPETFDWSSAKISYSLDIHLEASVHDYLIFKSGMPYEGFTDIEIH